MSEPKNLRPEKEVTKTSSMEKQIELSRQKDSELVRGVFKFYEVPGGILEFMYRKYKGDSPQLYKMQDNKVYTIPLGVAKHINNDCWYPTHEYSVDENGKPIQRAAIKNKRCGFQSLDFMDMEEYDRGGQQIIQVKNMAIEG